ncbi:uncharacterized protein LOC144211443 isoform X2 [Stigmatopora nigra]
MTSLAHWSFLGGTPGLPLGVYVKRHAQRRSLVSTRLGILVLTGSRRRRQPTRPGAQKRAAAAADRAVLVGEPGDLPERRNVRPQPDDGSTLVLLVPGPFSWDMVPNARRRRLLRGRRTLLPRLGVRVGERTPVPPMGPGHRVTLPELRRGRRPTQLLQECRLQAPSLVSRVERPAAALGILPRSSMRHRATVGLAAFHRGPADEPSGPTDHVGGDPSTVADHTGGRSCDDDGGGDRGTATHPQTGVGHVRAPLTAEAAAHRRRLGDAGGVAPVDGGHLVARQVQGKDLPLRRHLDLRMLGPQRRPLLPRQIRGCGAALPGGAGQERPQPDGRPGANVRRGTDHPAPRLQQRPGELRQRRRAAETQVASERWLRPGERRRPAGVPARRVPGSPGRGGGPAVRDRRLRQGEAGPVVPLAASAASARQSAGPRRVPAQRLLRPQDQPQHAVRRPPRLDAGRLRGRLGRPAGVPSGRAFRVDGRHQLGRRLRPPAPPRRLRQSQELRAVDPPLRPHLTPVFTFGHALAARWKSGSFHLDLWPG